MALLSLIKYFFVPVATVLFGGYTSILAIEWFSQHIKYFPFQVIVNRNKDGKLVSKSGDNNMFLVDLPPTMEKFKNIRNKIWYLLVLFFFSSISTYVITQTESELWFAGFPPVTLAIGIFITLAWLDACISIKAISILKERLDFLA